MRVHLIGASCSVCSTTERTPFTAR
jgi:hypothetical protein